MEEFNGFRVGDRFYYKDSPKLSGRVVSFDESRVNFPLVVRWDNETKWDNESGNSEGWSGILFVKIEKKEENNLKFKVGDKIHHRHSSYLTGEVTAINRTEQNFPYKVCWDNGTEYSRYSELELVLLEAIEEANEYVIITTDGENQWVCNQVCKSLEEAIESTKRRAKLTPNKVYEICELNPVRKVTYRLPAPEDCYLVEEVG